MSAADVARCIAEQKRCVDHLIEYGEDADLCIEEVLLRLEKGETMCRSCSHPEMYCRCA